MVWYVNDCGPIRSINACPQPGKCERKVQDDDPELLEFMENFHKVKDVDAAIDEQMNSPVISAVLAAVPDAEENIRESLRKSYESIK